MNTIARVTLLLGALSLLASAAQTQTSFGRNAVQYKTFHFKILKTQHFDVYFYDDEADAAAQAARMAERWYTRISTVLRHQLSSRQPLILYADHPAYNQTNIAQVEGSEGVTESLKRRILLPLGASPFESDHVIGHELTHAFQYDITGVARGNVATAFNRVHLVHRRDGGVRVARECRSEHDDVDARRGADRPSAQFQRSGKPAVLSVPLGSVLLGLPRWDVRR